MRKLAWCLTSFCLFYAVYAQATVFGQIQGIVHDPQHRPVRGAQVALHAVNSGFSQAAESNPEAHSLSPRCRWENTSSPSPWPA